MRVAFGALMWSPEQFWRSTLTEFVSGVEGLNRKNGGGDKPTHPTQDEMAELLARYG